jgi:quinol monooxygenase YgiN
MIVIAGFIRVPDSARSLLQPHIATYVPSCRSEPGCDAFELSYDALDSEILRVFEFWRDEESLKMHVASPHELTWRQACIQLGAGEHALTRYDISARKPIG